MSKLFLYIYSRVSFEKLLAESIESKETSEQLYIYNIITFKHNKITSQCKKLQKCFSVPTCNKKMLDFIFI